MLQAAQGYLKRGYSAIPVTYGEKAPPLVPWTEYQGKRPTDTDLAGWWSVDPMPNVALVTGAISGITVVDLDGEKGAQSFNSTGLPRETYTVKTPKGWHLYYRYTPDIPTGAGFLPGLDARGDGGYVIAPPSVVKGRPYRVLKSLDLAAIDHVPDCFRQRSQADHGQADSMTAPNWVSTLLHDGAPEGQRNHQAHRLAAYFRSKGHPRDIVLALMEPFYSHCDQQGFGRTELEHAVDSAMKYRFLPIDAEGDVPLVRESGASLIFEFSAGLELDLDGLYRDKAGLYCDLTIRGKSEGIPKKIHGPARWNLASTQARTGLLKYLGGRVDTDWTGILETVSTLVFDRFRTGDPIESLSDPVESADPWVLSPFLVLGKPTILFGDGGCGKSLLSLYWCGILTARGENCLYLDWESDRGDHARRLARLYPANRPKIGYKRCVGPLRDLAGQIKRQADEEGYTVIVIDSAGAASGGELESAEATLKCFDAIRQIGRTTLIVAHVPKQAGPQKPIGSTYWHNMARVTWETRKAQAEGVDTTEIVLANRKSNVGRLEAPRAYRIGFGVSITVVEIEAVEVAPEAADGMVSLKSRIYAALTHPMTYQEIAETIGSPATSVKTILHRECDSLFTWTASGNKRLWSRIAREF